ncbi:MAG: YggT family protein [Pseudomonadota bacterium]|nr:YggT family protein [Pseudomonadota bacterium]MEA3241661.1 YggT family protein [Pseudomonadota bacterium]
MFVLSNLLVGFAKILDIVLSLYMWLIIARAVLSWVNPDPYNAIVRFIYQVTEPVLSRVRRMIPTYGMGMDFSPIIVFLIIMFLQSFLVKSLFDLALRLSG